MQKLKLNLPIILLLVSILSIVSFSTIAQSQNIETKNLQTKDDFEDNLNLRRIFRQINSLNKEADKQEAKGFLKRADSLSSYFQRKTGISDNAKIKLNDLAGNFHQQLESLDKRITEILKSQKTDPGNGELTTEANVLKENRKKLFDTFRKSLYNDLVSDDLDRVLKFLREDIIARMKKADKSKPAKNPKDKISPNPFRKTSYEISRGGGLIEGYSFIDYDPPTNEMWATATTEGSCETYGDGDEREYECTGTYVNAVLSDPTSTAVAAENVVGSANYAEAYLYWSPVIAGEYCVDAEHFVEDLDFEMLYAQTFDCIIPDVPAPNSEISSVEFEQIDSPLDVNPGNGTTGTDIGARIFPDKTNASDTTNRAKVRVKATIAPAQADVTVYFKSFDLDDPSSNTAPLDDESIVQDNRGNVGGNKEGTLSANSALTDSNGVATVELTVTKQPGDNFAVAVSKDGTYLNNVAVNGIELKNGSQVVPLTGPTTSTNPAIRTDMLTVWRKLHIEYDSMGVMQNNKVSGIFPSNVTHPANSYPVLNVDVSPGLEINRFENGRLETGGQSYKIYANGSNTISIENPTSITITAGQSFTIYDDDDFNTPDDSAMLNGDEGDNIPPFNKDFLNENDIVPTSINTPNTNVLAAAYIRPVYDLPNSLEDTTVWINIADDTGAAVRSAFKFDNSTYEASTDFWTIYLLGGYQHILSEDGDPLPEAGNKPATLGVTDALNGQGSIAFIESLAPQNCIGGGISCSIPLTYAHEVGHLFSANHTEGGLIDDLSVNFSDISLNKIRSVTHP